MNHNPPYLFLSFELSIKLSLNDFLFQMLRSSVVEITSCVHTKTTIVFNLGEWQNNINLDFEE